METSTLSKIDLRKQTVINLVKSKGIENQKAQVVLVLDKSGSMRPLYNNGTVQETLERLVPIAMQFDDNGEMELYLFDNGCVKHKNTVTVNNVQDIVKREILGKYEFGSTEYANPIRMIKEDYFPAAKKGLFGFGKSEPSGPAEYPVYVIFITDGANEDRSATEAILREVSNYGAFFQFVGIGDAKLEFLEKLDNLTGRLIDNANFFSIRDLSKISDEELYAKLLNEFPQYLPLARAKNLIK